MTKRDKLEFLMKNDCRQRPVLVVCEMCPLYKIDVACGPQFAAQSAAAEAMLKKMKPKKKRRVETRVLTKAQLAIAWNRFHPGPWHGTHTSLEFKCFAKELGFKKERS
jgi:hypothetical protein